MSFFSSLTGGKQRHDLYEGQKEAANALDVGRKEATNVMRGGYDKADAALKRGQGQTNAAYYQGRGDVNAGATQALSLLSNSNALMQPYQAQGARANTMYGDAIGVNGTDARGAAQGTYMSDPIYASLMDKTNNDIFKRYNAGGMANSGASMQAILNSQVDGYGNWLDRLNGQGQMGFQAAGQMGQNNQAMASTATNRGNALASLAQWQGNNATDYAKNFASNRVNLGNSLGSMAWDMGNKKADLATSTRGALASTRGMGWQNALSLGGTALKAFTGGMG